MGGRTRRIDRNLGTSIVNDDILFVARSTSDARKFCVMVDDARRSLTSRSMCEADMSRSFNSV